MMRLPTLAAAASAAALMATGQPTFAFERMLRSDCQVSLEKIADLLRGLEPQAADSLVNAARVVNVNGQGWCRLEARALPQEDMEFDLLEWRAEDTTRWTREGIPPLALQVHVEGLDPDKMQSGTNTNRPDVTVDITLRQDPDLGQVILERAVLDNGAGDILSVSAQFERVFLTSPSMMQVSMGSVAFKAGILSMTLEGTHENPFAFEGDVQVSGGALSRSTAANDRLSRLPEGLMDDASRAALAAYVAELPSPEGTLEIVAGSERGFGLMQVGAALYSTVSAFMDEDALNRELEILFSGLTISANWTAAD